MEPVLRPLRLTPASWRPQADGAGLRAAALTVVGAWLILGWNRFGVQGLTAPRVMVRFVLIGFYAWLALAAAIWLIGQLASSRQASGSATAPPLPAADAFRRIVEVTGRAHRPLVYLAVSLQVLTLFGTVSGLGAVLATAATLWLAGMVVVATAATLNRPLVTGLAVAAVPLALWLATAGRYLLDQQRHLL